MKRFATVLTALVCAGAGAAHWLDLVNYTDLTTGFITYGPYWVRYAVLGLLLLLTALASLMVPRRCAVHTGSEPVQGLLCLPVGICFAVLGGMRLNSLIQAFRQTEQAPVKTTGLDNILTVLFFFSALWFLLLGLSRLSSRSETPTTNAIAGIMGTLSLYLLTIQRFCLTPTGVARVESILDSLAALAVLLFAVAQAKNAYLYSQRGGAWLYFTGMTAFLLAACLALPGAVAGYLVGEVSHIRLTEALVLGLCGLCGLAAAFAAAGRPAVSPDPAQDETQEPEPSAETAE